MISILYEQNQIHLNKKILIFFFIMQMKAGFKECLKIISGNILDGHGGLLRNYYLQYYHKKLLINLMMLMNWMYLFSYAQSDGQSNIDGNRSGNSATTSSNNNTSTSDENTF